MTPGRRGFTLIEILLVIALIGLFAGWAVTRVNLSGYRIDAAARMVQNTIIGAQQTAITRATDVTVRFDRQNQRIELRFLLNGSERVVTRPLPENAAFLMPSLGIDGSAADFVAGAGVTVTGNTYTRDVLFAANGTVPKGDFVIYLGTNADRPNDQRALAVKGATARVTFWTHNGGAWAIKDY